MIELVGTCIRCNSKVYCTDGFLNGITLEKGNIICFPCNENDPVVELLTKLLAHETFQQDAPSLQKAIQREGGEVRNLAIQFKSDELLKEIDHALTYGMSEASRNLLQRLKQNNNPS